MKLNTKIEKKNYDLYSPQTQYLSPRLHQQSSFSQKHDVHIFRTTRYNPTWLTQKHLNETKTKPTPNTKPHEPKAWIYNTPLKYFVGQGLLGK